MKVTANKPFATVVNGRPQSFQPGNEYEMSDGEARRLAKAGLVTELDPAPDPEPDSVPVAADTPGDEEPDKAARLRATKKVAAAPENKSE